jgi:hypothetical protein
MNLPPGRERRLMYERSRNRVIVSNMWINRNNRLNVRENMYDNLYRNEINSGGLISKDLLKNTMVLTNLFSDTYENDDKICLICHEQMTMNSIVRKLKCNHFYHINCVDTWLINNNTCPKCRNKII